MTPGRALLAVAGGLLLSALLLGISRLLYAPADWLATLWWSLLLGAAGIALLDALRLRRQPSPEIKRQLPGEAPVGRWQEVRLELRHGSRVRVQVFDHAPASLQVDSLPVAVRLAPGETATLSYLFCATERGLFHFEHCEVQLPSPWRLWHSRRLLTLPGDIRIYPDFSRLHGARLMAVENWLGGLGIRQRPRRGPGQEFRQLREYRDGDTLRQVDWKATARVRHPIVREYQDERDQRILFLLDGGRRMRSQDGGKSHFDHSLEACLLLSHVALRQGDAVGLSTFATEQPRFVAPGKGPAQLTSLLDAMYDLRSSRAQADYSSAAATLLARQRRRALVIVLTNLRDEDDDELDAALAHLSQRHRVLLVSLREEFVDHLAQTPITGLDEALDYCGLVDYRAARQRLHRRLTARGLPLLDARPRELAPLLIERYLALKRAGSF
ncbi:DUF58 domain-containing protein [Stutzerimonas tarimensis]|uniref:DUF58 domain-containing protein n=1 Tax=Stutzerimonas tarimensis TaxID=1507735 RepID=A0ABV7T1A6_9GAMM